MSDKLSIVLFSGTADKLMAATIMASGAAAMGTETHVFLTFWGLNAFRKSVIEEPAPMTAEYGQLGETMGKLMVEKGVPPWYETLRAAKEIGDVHVYACGMTADLMELTLDDFDPMVESIIGVGKFIELSDDGRTMFI